MGSEAEGVIDVENTIFVAVGRNLKEGKSTLLWALQNSDGKRICLLHVHQPANLITLMDGKFSSNKLKQQTVKAFRELEQQKMNKLLNQYLLILGPSGAGTVWLEQDNVEKGIVKVVAKHDIKWLVMGAAADKHYSKELSELKSKKAIYVCQQAPISCQIWFTCKRCLIYTRSGDGTSSVGITPGLSSPTSERGMLLLQSSAYANGDAKEPDRLSKSLTSPCSVNSTDKLVDTIQSITFPMDETRGDISLLALPCKSQLQDNLHQSSSFTSTDEKSQQRGPREVYDRLEHATLDVENSKQRTFEESVRRWKAEEDATEAMQKAEASESLCTKEINRRKELEEILGEQQQEIEKMQNQHDQFIKELRAVEDQKRELESRLADSHSIEVELEEKMQQAAKLLIAFKGKRDELQAEHKKIVREISGLRNFLEGGAESVFSQRCYAFSFLEINEATRDFDPSWKIGDGRYGSVYKGFLHCLKVAIKMLPNSGSQGHVDFELEAGSLGNVRHPNLVTLIGTCPESRSVVYEYLENGSLEDRLTCQGKTPPLSWQTRAKIASELCSVLIFLHSSNPRIVHGNLKPTKILLDANLVCKLSDLGIHRLIPKSECNKSDSEVSVYTDPESLENGEFTVESDVYSFGIVLLRLMTGRPALGIVEDVEFAVECGDISSVLDVSAGDWPVEQAKQLADVALKCCEKKRAHRAELVSDVWGVIESMRNLGSSSCTDSKSRRKIPSQFVCPILQEVMEDPHIAADGFTYEAEAINGWINSGHKTSPMTNLQLDHCNLLPNYALYYAIQEWQQQS